jgi:hypothetical protein
MQGLSRRLHMIMSGHRGLVGCSTVVVAVWEGTVHLSMTAVGAVGMQAQPWVTWHRLSSGHPQQQGLLAHRRFPGRMVLRCRLHLWIRSRSRSSRRGTTAQADTSSIRATTIILLTIMRIPLLSSSRPHQT